MKTATKKKPVSRLSPRHLSPTVWYYINAASVDLIAESRRKDGSYITTVSIRVTLRMLKRMLAEFGTR